MFMYMAAFFMPGWRRAQMKRYGLSGVGLYVCAVSFSLIGIFSITITLKYYMQRMGCLSGLSLLVISGYLASNDAPHVNSHSAAVVCGYDSTYLYIVYGA